MKYLFKFSVVLIFLLSTLIINATTYYVRDDGNDSNTGLSDAQAWKTISKVNSFSFAPGDDVYFKCGDTWTQTALTVDWAGTSSDYVTIGSYYGDGLVGVSGDRPIFDGENSFPGGSTPQWVAMVQISSDYVTVENLHIKRSQGRGIAAKNCSYINVYNCYVFDTITQGIIYEYVENGNIEDNKLEECAYWKELDPSSNTYSTALAVMHKSYDVNIRRNLVFNTHGEAINTWDRSERILIEYNVCYNFRSVGIYMDNNADITVRYNLVYNLADQTYWRWAEDGDIPGFGIWNTIEWTSYDKLNYNLKVYGNLVAGCGVGLWIGQGQNATNPATNIKYYNNTVIDCNTNFKVLGSLSGCEVKNNIFYKTSSECTQTSLTGSYSGLTLANNLWSSTVASGVLGSNSLIDDPDLYKSNGWRDLSAGLVDAEDFSLLSTSPAIGAGANLGSEYDDALNKNSIWPSNVNILDQDSYGNWEIGGVVYASTGVSLPGLASNPNPSNGSIDVSVNSSLSWTSGTNAISHDVYFGTSNPPSYVQNQTSTSYSPGTLSNNTTYYWRIDEVNSGGTTTGTVWSFTTESTSTVGNTLLHYNFSDGSGTVVTDLSGNGNNGTLVNFTSTSSGAGTFNSSEGWVTGGGLSFLDNGVGSHVETPIALNELYDGSSNKDFTIEYSANYSGASGWTAIVGTDPTSWDGTACLFLGINDLQTLNNVRVPQASAFTIGSIPWSAPDATQHHIALVFDSSENEFELFVDKESLGTSTASGINMNSSSEIIIGSTGWQLTSEKWAGIVYGIAISDTKLDTSSFVLDNLILPGLANNPNPSNGSIDVSVNSSLSWTSGTNATSHDVYFGTSNPPSYIQNQTSTSYSAGTLSNNTTYYWRIDEVNSGGTTTGTVWSFTTETASIVGNTLLHYDFSDGSGSTVTDLSGNGNNGTLVNFSNTSSGGGVYNVSEGWVSGGGLNLLDNGVGSYISTPLALNSLYDGSSTKDFTIEYSANYAGASGWTAIIGSDPTSWDETGSLFVGINDLQTLNNFRIPNSSAYTIGSVPWNAPDATKHHVALVFDSSENEYELFVDGESVGINTQSGTDLNSNSKFIIGTTGWQLTTEKWDGVIYGIAISDVKLDANSFILENNDPEPATLPQASNIVGHWKLDNTTSDVSGNGYDGIWYGGGTYSTDAKVGSYSGDFTGDYSLVALPTSIGQTEMKTLSFWMKREGINLGGASYSYPLRKENLYFQVRDDGRLQFRAGNVYSTIYSYVTDNVWIHVTGVIDGTNVKLYCNGQLMHTSSGTTGLSNTSDFFGIAGYYHGNWATFNGKIDNVVVWNVALTDSEVLEVANYTGLSKTVNGEIEKTEIALPNDLAVINYPNPFNPSTNIHVSIPNNGKVKVSVFNMLGEKVNELFNGELVAGTHNIMWNGKSSNGNKLSSGIYFYHVEYNKSNLVGKMILMK